MCIGAKRKAQNGVYSNFTACNIFDDFYGGELSEESSEDIRRTYFCSFKSTLTACSACCCQRAQQKGRSFHQRSTKKKSINPRHGKSHFLSFFLFQDWSFLTTACFSGNESVHRMSYEFEYEKQVRLVHAHASSSANVCCGVCVCNNQRNLGTRLFLFSD